MVTKSHTKFLLFRKLIAACCMSLLLLLTGVNFAVYGFSSDKDLATDQIASFPEEEAPSNNNPSGPDEKTSDTPVSVSDEFLHEYADANFILNSGKSLTYIQYQSALCHQYYPVFTPPPNS